MSPLSAIEALELAIGVLEGIERAGADCLAPDELEALERMRFARDEHHEREMKDAQRRQGIRELAREVRKS